MEELNYMNEILKIGIGICEKLDELHTQGKFHRNINFDNIKVDTNTKVTLFSSNKIQIQFYSPEQTGRINKQVDYRTDLYSLGIYLYYLLTKRFPFESENKLELIYKIIATKPAKPNEINNEIPTPVSNIIIKLLEKNPEERYQSALGVKYDLEKVIKGIKLNTLGEKDVADFFTIPQKLYGRTNELDQIFNSFKLTQKNKKEIVIISGYSGIGKTSLVQELKEPITSKKGYLISGKFDQYNRSTPYYPIIQAIENWVGQISIEPFAKIENRKKDILKTVGNDVYLLTRIIPKLELLIGKQTEPGSSSDSELHIRFVSAFKKLIRAISNPEQPLIIFIDDLQWLESASISLMESIIADNEIGSLLLIFSYRDNEVDISHPIHLFLKKIEEVNANYTKINLRALSFSSYNDFIADTLKTSSEEAASFSKIIFNRTGGNPFFTKQLLHWLYNKRLIYFDAQAIKWTWELSNILKTKISDNVVDILLQKLNETSKEFKKLIALASIIGVTFDLKILSKIYGKSNKITENNLQFGIDNNFIHKNDYLLSQQTEIQDHNIEYSFSHDRIQQAAYLLTNDKEKTIHHYTIACYLKDNIDENHKDFYNLIEHYNKSISLINSQEERTEIALLNLKAGINAKNSGAFYAAKEYLLYGQKHIEIVDWNSDFGCKLYINLAETEYLCNNYSSAVKIIQEGLSFNLPSISKAKLYQLLVIIYTVQSNYKNAIENGKKGLLQLGIELPEDNYELNLDNEIKISYSLTENRELQSIYNSPTLNSEEKLLALQILVDIAAPCWIYNPSLYGIVVAKSANICMKHGISAISANVFATYGLVLATDKGMYEKGFQYSLLGMQISEKFNSSSEKCKSFDIMGAHVYHWRKHIKDSIPILESGFKAAFDSDGMQWAGYISQWIVVNSFSAGENILTINKEIKKHLKFNIKAKHVLIIDTIKGVEILTNRLQQSNKDYNVIEEEHINNCLKNHSELSLFNFYVLKAYVSLIFNKPAEALAAIVESEKYKSYSRGTITIATQKFYNSLALWLLYNNVTNDAKLNYFNQLKDNLNEIEVWAENAPMNFSHHKYFIEGILHDIDCKRLSTMDLFDKAINLAHDNGFTHDEALLNELTAKYFQIQNKNQISKGYLEEAIQKYSQWGATAKVEKIISENNLVFKGPDYQIINRQELDWLSINEATQLIASDMNLNTLLEKVMQILIKITGATKGVLNLHLPHHESILNTQSIDGNIKTIYGENSDINLPKNIIKSIQNFKKNIIINNISNTKENQEDEYFVLNKTKSIMCLPVFFKNDFSGLIYFENKFINNAFTNKHIEVLNILTVHIINSIENALLYRESITSEEEIRASNEELIATTDALKEQERILIEKNEEYEALNEELMQTNEELYVAKEKVEESDRLKTEFLQNISHEIRTPMNGILGFSRLLNAKNISPGKKKNYINIIQNSGNQLLRIIDDILEISSLETKQVKLSETEVCLNDFLLNLFSIFDIKAKENKTPLYLKKGLSDVESTIFIDETKLNKILGNLLENALKFTNTGHIEFGYQLKNNSLEIFVKDSGIGINPGMHQKIFERFSQEEKELSKNVGGLGLGLSIAKENTELLGGKITLKSEKNKGATFFVVIPYKPVIPNTEISNSKIPENKNKQYNHTILIVEDEEVNYLYLEALLQDEMNINCNILHAKHGKEAVEICKENTEIEIILMDLKMPVMNGFEATEIIKKLKPNLPIIAQTAYTTSEDKEKAFLAGCNDFISKPINTESFSLLLKNYLIKP